MNVVSEVMIVALSTAVLAALIVAADWDLVVIRALQPLIAAHQDSDRNTMARPSVREATATWADIPPGVQPTTSAFERTQLVTGVAQAWSDEAEEWLAAAATGQLLEWRRIALGRRTPMNQAAPARPLREVLAARPNHRPVDDAAA